MADELKLENVPKTPLQDKELLVSLEDGKVNFEIPIFDFALTRRDEIIYVCTRLNNQIDRIFFQITNFPQNFEQNLKIFMNPPSPEALNRSAFSLPILPSFEGENLFIPPSSTMILEDFIDDEESLNESDIEENENKSHQNHQNQNQDHIKSKQKSEISYKYSNIHHRMCLNCLCTTTPMWRRGPDGTASLCNACGVKFKAGKLQLSPTTLKNNLVIVRKYAESKGDVDNNNL